MSETIDATKVIAQVTGISQQEQVDILEEVKANLRTLAACQLHDFCIPIDRHTKEPRSQPNFGCKWKCANCGGTVDGPAKTWYERGLDAGRKSK